MPRCTECGQANPEGFRFCGACGTRLTAPSQPSDEERKIVTVVFCDLVGFTARSDHADPEDVGAMLRPYHVRLRREIERMGGTLDKFIGDGVMAVFGAPVAHEDDPERAVRCALRMLEAIADLNRARPALELSVRIGVNTGEALVALRPGSDSEAVVGDVVNTASRLEGVAPVGGVVVGEATWQATRALFDYEQMGPVQVKGKAERVPVWRVLGTRSRLGVAVEQRSATAFIGRQDELALLRRLYAEMRRQHLVQLVSVVGEPGVGKSRLVREFFGFIDAQEELVSWRQGRCLAYGEGITFWALREIVQAQAGILESDDPEQSATKLATAVQALVEDAAEQEWLKARLGLLLGLGRAEAPGAERSELFTAWRRFVQAMAAAAGPLVMVVEDLHWAEPALLDFLEELCERLTEVDLLIVATARPELFERRPTWGQGTHCEHVIALPPLDNNQTARLLAALVGTPVLPADVQALLLERAGGNPLYAEEFVRLLIDRGLLVRHRSGVRLSGRDIPLPETLQALIAARLDTLSPDHKALIQDAAVVGKVFWSGGLAAISGVDEPVVRHRLRGLEQKELVRTSHTSSVAHQAEYVFWHGLVRDVAYAQIPRARRARRHRAAAGWLQGLAGERVGDHAEMIAHHYTEALWFARVAGELEERAALEDPARRFLIQAGDRAIRLDVARAESYYRQALELSPPAHPQHARVLGKLVGAVQQAGRLLEAEQLCQEAIVACQARGELLEAGDLLIMLAQICRNRGQVRRSRAVLAEGMRLLEAQPAGPELANAFAQKAFDALVSGQLEEAVAWADKTAVLADELDLGQQRVRALMDRGSARCELGNLEGLNDLRAALEAALALGLGRETAAIANNLGEELWPVEGPAAALESLEWAVDFAERRGIEEIAIWIRTSTMGPRFDLGDWDQLLGLTDEVLAWTRAHGGSYLDVWAQVYQAQVLLYRGQSTTSLGLAQQFIPRAREIGDPEILVPALTVAALVELGAGNLRAALQFATELDETTTDHSGWFRAQQLPDLVRIFAAADELDVANELIRHSQSPAARHQHGSRTAQAVIAEREGDLDRAVLLYREAANGWGQYGHVLERAQALFGWGRCLVYLDRPQAGSALREARAVFTRLGAQTLMTEGDVWLTRATA